MVSAAAKHGSKLGACFSAGMTASGLRAKTSSCYALKVLHSEFRWKSPVIRHGLEDASSQHIALSRKIWTWQSMGWNKGVHFCRHYLKSTTVRDTFLVADILSVTWVSVSEFNHFHNKSVSPVRLHLSTFLKAFTSFWDLLQHDKITKKNLCHEFQWMEQYRDFPETV